MVTNLSNPQSPEIRRIAILSVHTSPLHQPGTGDSGGMNVYVAETAKRIAARGIEVEIFTRATSLTEPETTQLASGVLVRHIPAGPFEGLRKEDLPAQLCAVTAGVLRAEAAKNEGFYDLIHSHYWLSGQVGWIAQERWGVPLVHTMHTMARVKNLTLAKGDSPEPAIREIGEEQVVTAADRLVANTHAEAKELIELYHADPKRVRVVHPGVDLDKFIPGDKAEARKDLGIANDAIVLLFVGRIQPLEAG
jgi:D-inositol-3-phosphate glycosyltransferase